MINRLISDWQKKLGPVLELPEVAALFAYLDAERQQGKAIFPAEKDIFSAFNLVLPEQVKIVMLGQDPYHGAGQAHGMAFSVRPGCAVPPSLRNIYKELKQDLSIEPPDHGYLRLWAEQGVLLLNSVLTVEQALPGSHRGKGWELVTDQAIRVVSDQPQPAVFMLWGKQAQLKVNLIDDRKHLILMATHPSPLSAHRGFLGCKHFSKANEFLKSCAREPINWSLPAS